LKILLVSEHFHPRVGGVEMVTRLLGSALVRMGHTVVVVTRESADASEESRFVVLRRPGPFRLLWEYATADSVIVQGLALGLAWPLFWSRESSLIVHHMESSAAEGAVKAWWRTKLARFARHAAVSEALARHLPWLIEAVLHNPYDAEVFRVDPATPRERDVIFVGRLIPEKGAAVLVSALSLLRQTGESISATIVGDGPERIRLSREVKLNRLEKCVQFGGEVTGSSLAQLLNQHRLMVVPSLVNEGFGLVALEGIACGCVVIGSHAGGLPEAIGPCGITFPAGNAELLAANIQRLLSSHKEMAGFQAAAETHLAGHHPSEVARRYVALLSGPRTCSADFQARMTPIRKHAVGVR
jgi:glycosyltransferase involved in cell wall biosynthesis